jgi:DNA end-binding protein Ku
MLSAGLLCLPMTPARTAVLSLGLVSIPVEIFPAIKIKDQGVHFNWLHAKCGSRGHNRMLCPVCNETVEWADLVRGYEVSKNQYASFC